MNKKYQIAIFISIVLVVIGALLVSAFPILSGHNPRFDTPNDTWGGSAGTSRVIIMMNFSDTGAQNSSNTTSDTIFVTLVTAVTQVNTTNVSFWYSKDNTTWTNIPNYGTAARADGNSSATDATYNVTWDINNTFGGEANNLSILVVVTNDTAGAIHRNTTSTNADLDFFALNGTLKYNITWHWGNWSLNGNATNDSIPGILLDTRAPRIVGINVTARMVNGSILGNTIGNGSLDGTGYIQNYTDNENGLNLSVVQIAVQIADLHASSVLIAYNTTNGPVNSSAVNITTIGTVNFTGTGDNSNVSNITSDVVSMKFVIPMKNITIAANGSGNLSKWPANPSTWLVNITKANFTSLDKSNLTFAVIINDTASHFTIDSRTVAGYKVAFGSSAGPIPKLSLSKTAIDVQGSIDITCSVTADPQGVNGSKTKIFLQKPSDTSLLEFASGKETITLSSADTGEAGTYYTACTAEDNTGKQASTSSLSFLATYSTAGPTTGAGGGGGGASTSGGGGTTTIKEEEVLYVTETPASVTSPLGGFVKFTLDKTNVHTLTVDSLTETAAIIVLTPIGTRETLDLGASKDIDITNDGITDITTTLSGIVDGTAQLTLKVVEAAAPAEEVTKEVTEEKPIKRGLGWLWILIIIVIIAIIVALVVRKKRR